MPKKQTTAAKKARVAQSAHGGKHTTHLLNVQTCGKDLDPWGVYPGIYARPLHDDTEPCSGDRNFDIEAWKTRQAAEDAEAEARWAAMSPEQRTDAENRAREDEQDDGRTGADDIEDTRSWKWED